MLLENLSNSLKNTLKRIAGSLFVDEALINDLVRDIQRALLRSDVNVRLVLDLTTKIKERALHEEAPGRLSKKEQLISIIYEELVGFLGEEEHAIEITKKPTTIMLVGLFGSGKTTTAAKLGKYLAKRGHKVALLQTDAYRPAAYEQLKQLGRAAGVDVLGNPKSKAALNIYREFEPELNKYDAVIIDTAGRDALSDELIDELNRLARAARPDERLLVLSADIGQAADAQARAFHESCDVTGVIITKLDGTAKGGGALAACAVTKAYVRFIGLGEKIDDFEGFSPEGFVGRLLGMGDIEALLEKAKGAIAEGEVEDLTKRISRGQFNLIDLYEQMQAMSKMGPLNKLIDMIPGFGQIKLPKDALRVQEGKLKKWKFIMDSMTREELENPEKINTSRIERIAKGSGASAADIRELIKHYRQSKKLIKMMKGMDEGSMQRIMERVGMKGGI